jgi:hypothetical protein
VIKWRRQYAESGLAGLEDAPRGGGPVTVLTGEAVCEILAATVTPPPESLRAQEVTHWSARRLADWLHRPEAERTDGEADRRCHPGDSVTLLQQHRETRLEDACHHYQ